MPEQTTTKNTQGQHQGGLSWARPSATTQAPGTKPTLARSIGIFAAGVIVGVLVTWGYVSATERRPAAPSSTTTTNQAASVVVASSGAAQSAFEVASPQPAGKKVMIERIVVSRPTWVVVYDSENGALGRALGAALFSATKNTGAVTLLRATVPGKTYLVGEAADNRNGTFTLKTDEPVMQDGERLLRTVIVQ